MKRWASIEQQLIASRFGLTRRIRWFGIGGLLYQAFQQDLLDLRHEARIDPSELHHAQLFYIRKNTKPDNSLQSVRD